MSTNSNLHFSDDSNSDLSDVDPLELQQELQDLVAQDIPSANPIITIQDDDPELANLAYDDESEDDQEIDLGSDSDDETGERDDTDSDVDEITGMLHHSDFETGTWIKPVKGITKPTRIIGSRIVKKPHKFKPGTVALREIRKMQKGTDAIIPRLPFNRLVREIAQDLPRWNRDTDLWFEAPAIEALLTASEDLIIKVLSSANLLAIHAGRSTLFPKDIQAAKHVTEALSGKSLW
ncbi:Core histone H2A/H2B/H3/H4 domain-containing protein [uncultured virus]|nr:Core histone H2A/H2B/H3/H4 domain-containing protein [uncultured virus]